MEPESPWNGSRHTGRRSRLQLQEVAPHLSGSDRASSTFLITLLQSVRLLRHDFQDFSLRTQTSFDVQPIGRMKASEGATKLSLSPQRTARPSLLNSSIVDELAQRISKAKLHAEGYLQICTMSPVSGGEAGIHPGHGCTIEPVHRCLQTVGGAWSCCVLDGLQKPSGYEAAAPPPACSSGETPVMFSPNTHEAPALHREDPVDRRPPMPNLNPPCGRCPPDVLSKTSVTFYVAPNGRQLTASRGKKIRKF